MISGAIGISSPGQFSPGAIGQISPIESLLSAPFNRTFFVPQNGLPWIGKKTPESLLNFSFDWVSEIKDDLIISSTWELESTDITNKINGIDSYGAVTTILISGGISHSLYNVTNLITTESGLQLDATFRLLVIPYNW